MARAYNIREYDFEYGDDFDFILFSATILNLVSMSSWKLFHNKDIFETISLKLELCIKLVYQIILLKKCQQSLKSAYLGQPLLIAQN